MSDGKIVRREIVWEEIMSDGKIVRREIVWEEGSEIQRLNVGRMRANFLTGPAAHVTWSTRVQRAPVWVRGNGWEVVK